MLVCAKNAPAEPAEPRPGWLALLHPGEIEAGLAGLR
jgi:hypothetical protein